MFNRQLLRCPTYTLPNISKLKSTLLENKWYGQFMISKSSSKWISICRLENEIFPLVLLLKLSMNENIYRQIATLVLKLLKWNQWIDIPAKSRNNPNPLSTLNLYSNLNNRTKTQTNSRQQDEILWHIECSSVHKISWRTEINSVPRNTLVAKRIFAPNIIMRLVLSAYFSHLNENA